MRSKKEIQDKLLKTAQDDSLNPTTTLLLVVAELLTDIREPIYEKHLQLKRLEESRSRSQDFSSKDWE